MKKKSKPIRRSTLDFPPNDGLECEFKAGDPILLTGDFPVVCLDGSGLLKLKKVMGCFVRREGRVLKVDGYVHTVIVNVVKVGLSNYAGNLFALDEQTRKGF